MVISIDEPRAKDVWFDESNLWLELVDGRRLSVPLDWFPRLQHATSEQRCNVEMLGGGQGLHWPEIDEDIEVAGLLAGLGDQTRLGNGPVPKAP